MAEELDRCLEGAAAGEGVPSPEIEAAAEVARELRRALTPPSSTARHRARVWAHLEPQLASDASRVRRPVRRLRLAYALAGLVLALFMATGTTAAYASEGALPGDPLYPVKRGLETARLALSLSEEGDASLIATFADRRLAEIEALGARGRWNDVEAALPAYSAGLDSLVETEAAADGQLTHHLQVLERVRSRAPAAAVPGLTRALERAAWGKEEARQRRDVKNPPPEAPGKAKETAEPSGVPDDKAKGTPRRPGGLPPGWEKRLTQTP